MRKVKTAKGRIEPISNVKKIKGRYYIKNEDCFLMPDGKWYRKTSPIIFFDYETKKYRFLSELDCDENILYGIVKIVDGVEINGYFSKNPAKNVKIRAGFLNFMCISRDVARKKYSLELRSGEYKPIGSMEKSNILTSHRNVGLNYGVDNNLETFSKHFNENFKGEQLKSMLWEHLPNVTFGLEHETLDGRIEECDLYENGLIPLMDGSLRRDGYLSLEYSTIVLSGKTGIEAIKKHSKLLKEYCKIGLNSLHIHIGNIPVSKEYVYALYLLVTALEAEIFDMFPAGLKDTSSYKEKSYCSPLRKFRFKKDDAEGNFDKIYKYLAMNEERSFSHFGEGHPKDQENNHKWEVSTRYKFCNFIPLIFGRNQTVEWRIHPSTFDHQKMINWLFIVSAISQYAYDNKESISKRASIKITLNDVISEVYSESKFLQSYLKAYIQYRKEFMQECADLNDTKGEIDILNDNLNNFNYKQKYFI